MQTQHTIGSFFKSMNLTHYIICIGFIFILAAARVYIKQHPSTEEFQSQKIFEIIGIGIGAIGVLAARFIFFYKAKEAHTVFSLARKLNIFRYAHLLQIAILEGVGFINIVFYFLTKEDIHFFIAVGIAIMLVFRRPQRQIAAMVLFSGLDDKQIVYDDSIPLS
ncbi:MAG: hypothetical protein R2739_08710 [Chitinophagales bacterium]